MKIENVMIKISGGNDQVLLKNGRSPGTGGNSPKTSTRLEGEGWRQNTLKIAIMMRSRKDFQISPKNGGGEWWVQGHQIAFF